jgi:hypothetical protein
VREDEKESEFAYYGSGFVQAVLKSELLELKFFGILSVRVLQQSGMKGFTVPSICHWSTQLSRRF